MSCAVALTVGLGPVVHCPVCSRSDFVRSEPVPLEMVVIARQMKSQHLLLLGLGLCAWSFFSIFPLAVPQATEWQRIGNYCVSLIFQREHRLQTIRQPDNRQ